jgi:hypothetical protein
LYATEDDRSSVGRLVPQHVEDRRNTVRVCVVVCFQRKLFPKLFVFVQDKGCLSSAFRRERRRSSSTDYQAKHRCKAAAASACRIEATVATESNRIRFGTRKLSVGPVCRLCKAALPKATQQYATTESEPAKSAFTNSKVRSVNVKDGRQGPFGLLVDRLLVVLFVFSGTGGRRRPSPEVTWKIRSQQAILRKNRHS